jgi:hypothetical protein
MLNVAKLKPKIIEIVKTIRQHLRSSVDVSFFTKKDQNKHKALCIEFNDRDDAVTKFVANVLIFLRKFKIKAAVAYWDNCKASILIPHDQEVKFLIFNCKKLKVESIK